MVSRKKWSSAVKFEIILQVLKGEKTLAEICKRYEVSPSQVHAWKKDFLDSGAQIFDRKEKAVIDSELIEKKEQKLYETIEQLTVERDFLKKSWSKLHGKNDKN